MCTCTHFLHPAIEALLSWSMIANVLIEMGKCIFDLTSHSWSLVAFRLILYCVHVRMYVRPAPKGVCLLIRPFIAGKPIYALLPPVHVHFSVKVVGMVVELLVL